MKISVPLRSRRSLYWILPLVVFAVVILPIARTVRSRPRRGDIADVVLSPVMLMCDKSNGCEHLCSRLATTVGLRNQWLNLRLVHSIKLIDDTIRRAWEDSDVVIETREFDLTEFDLIDVPKFEDVDAERLQ